MAKLIVSEFITLDGIVEAPGGEATHPHSGWVGDYIAQEQLDYKHAEVLAAESLLIGRVTYEGFSAAWPGREGEFADKMNSMPKFVVSSTLAAPLGWNNSTLITGDLVPGVEKLKARDGGPVLAVGSATLVAALIEHDLVDELRLMVFPVMIGGGLRCFPTAQQKHPFELADITTFDTGVAVHTYRRAGA